MRTFRKQQQGGSQATSSAASLSEGALSPSAALSPPSAAGTLQLQSGQPAAPPTSGHPSSGFLLEGSGPSGGSPTPRSSLTAALKGASPVQTPTPTFQVQSAAGSTAAAIPGRTTVGFSVEAKGFVPAAHKAQSSQSGASSGAATHPAGDSQVCIFIHRKSAFVPSPMIQGSDGSNLLYHSCCPLAFVKVPKSPACSAGLLPEEGCWGLRKD